MVTGKSVAFTVFSLLAVGAIVAVMQRRKMDTESYSLVEACRVAEGEGLIDSQSCDAFKTQNWNWDTRVPCITDFKAGDYFWTPRHMVEAVKNGGLSWGEGVLETTRSHCLPQLEADADFEGFLSGEGKDWQESVSIARSKNVKRDLFWGRRRRRRAINYNAGWHSGNYKACSVNFLFNDKANCALQNARDYTPHYGGNSRCGRACVPSNRILLNRPGGSCDGSWQNDHEDNLNKACLAHDTCLVDLDYRDACGCDRKLASEAGGCTWGRCGGGWFDARSVAAGIVSAAMYAKSIGTCAGRV